MSQVTAFDTAYPGSMSERTDGYFLRRDDHKSMAAAMVELIASRYREIEDLRDSVTSYKRFINAAPYLMDVARSAASIGFHTMPDRAVCMCTQCELVRDAQAAIAKAEQS